MKIKNTMIGLLLTLAMGNTAAAMSTFTEQWMVGQTLHASASTDSDGVSEYASVDLYISGPSGTSSTGYDCVWYSGYTTTSLALTTSGDHSAISSHWTQSVAALSVVKIAKYRRPVQTNFDTPTLSGGVCTYNEDCPGAGGGNTRLCSNVAATQTHPPFAGTLCLDYLHHDVSIAWKLPLFNWVCGGGSTSTSQTQGSCTEE